MNFVPLKGGGTRKGGGGYSNQFMVYTVTSLLFLLLPPLPPPSPFCVFYSTLWTWWKPSMLSQTPTNDVYFLPQASVFGARFLTMASPPYYEKNQPKKKIDIFHDFCFSPPSGETPKYTQLYRNKIPSHTSLRDRFLISRKVGDTATLA